jgi:hypothetical protein
MIHASPKFKFKEIWWNCQLLLDLSRFGDFWATMNDQLLNHWIEIVSMIDCLQRHSGSRHERSELPRISAQNTSQQLARDEQEDQIRCRCAERVTWLRSSACVSSDWRP